MDVSARLDVDVLAAGTPGEVSVLVELTAPSVPRSADRQPATLEVVLDRSGSMAGAALDGAIEALCQLVGRLDEHDNFGVVAFDDEATVVVPAGPVRDKPDVVRRLRNLASGGRTDLCGGYLRGLAELRRVADHHGGTLLLISDGYANEGVTDPAELSALAQRACGHRVVTSTLGYGLGYDETSLLMMARAGSGNHHFARDPAAAGAAIAAEVAELLAKSVQATSLVLELSPEVSLARIYNDLPTSRRGANQVVVEIGDLYSGEQRRLVLRLTVPGLHELGPATLGTVELRYVEPVGLVEHATSVPLRLDVVPRQAVRRSADRRVRTEVLFQEAQAAKREAAEALDLGERELATELFGKAERSLLAALELAPAEMAEDVAGDRRRVENLRGRSTWDDTNLLSKASRASFHRLNRRRARGAGPDAPPPA